MGSLSRREALAGGDGLHHAKHARQDHLSAPGRDLDYQLTDAGWGLLSELDIVVPAGRRRLVAYCVDWTEQRHHLAGAVGAALLHRFVELDWVRRRATTRALTVTDAGLAGFSRHFGIDAGPSATR